ncbi:MAG: hypothetical protein ACRYHQ_41490, partial [Janthinobacterium lividum]
DDAHEAAVSKPAGAAPVSSGSAGRGGDVRTSREREGEGAWQPLGGRGPREAALLDGQGAAFEAAGIMAVHGTDRGRIAGAPFRAGTPPAFALRRAAFPGAAGMA